MAINISLEELVKTGAHFGHQVRRWNPKMAEYLYGEKDGVHVFDLIKTKQKLTEALEFLTNAAREGKIALFVGTKKQAKEKVIEIAKETSSFYVTERWLGGTFTNLDQIRKSTRKLTEMKEKAQKGEYREFTKKERLLIDREIQRLERFFGGVVGMEKLPDVLVVIDTKKERGAVAEANFKGIATVAIVDSNSDPFEIDYPIPMNDDATKAVSYVLDLMREAIMEGKLGKGTTSGRSSKGSKGETKKAKSVKS